MNRSELVFAKQKYVDYEVLSIISTFLQCIVGSAFNIAVSESSQLVREGWQVQMLPKFRHCLN